MSMQNSTNKEDFEEYLRRFPDGVFEGLARRRTDEFGQLALAAERLPEPELEAVGDDFFALKTSNVRDRPSTQAEIVGRLGQGVPVSVRGKAKGINWYLVARNDKEFGYVHGNLLARLNAPVEPVGRVLMVRPVVYQARQMTEATRLIIAKLDQLPNTVVIESSKTPRAHDILISAEVTQVAWRQEINPGIVGKNLAQRLLGLPIPPTPAYTPSVDVAVLLTVTEARTGRILGSEVGRSVRQAQSNGDQSAVDQAIITAIFDGCGSGMANVSY